MTYKTLKASNESELKELMHDYIEQGYQVKTLPHRVWWANDETAWRCKMEVPKGQLEIRTENGGWR
jgi:hypothetical protein